jgi:hypothetical protein
VPVTSHDLQRMWDDAWDSAPEGGATFREELRKYERRIGELISTGSVSSISKNSASQTYATYSVGTLTQVEITRAWRQLINLFDDIAASLVACGKDSDDEAVYAAGKTELRDAGATVETFNDYSEARCR